MPGLNARQFERVEELFFRASSMPPEQRDTFLASACADDSDVREQVRGMLKHAGGRAERLGDSLLDDALASMVAAPAATPGGDALLRQLIGTRVGAYEFTDILGQGGMGVVYLARDVRLARTVAIKALPPGLSRHPLRMSRFVREAKILASLSHQNIATVYGLEESAGMKFLVMERVEGETLARRLSRGALPIEEAIEVGREVAAGVEVAHAAGVIHRDLKPGNVMFKADGSVKVLDFGLARELSRSSTPLEATLAGASSEQSEEKLTSEGSVLGTPGYMSPEQIRGKPVDRRTDIFALGCILFECLTGQVAFPGETGADVIAGILEREPDWRRLPAKTPAAVRRLLLRCVAKDADERMRDMGDVRLELRDALAAREWVAGPDGAEDNGRSRVRRFAAAIPLVLSAALLAAAVGIVALRPAPSGSAPSPQPLLRFALQFPGGVPQSDLSHVRLALSRDGRRIVLAASDPTGRHLWVRDRADTDFRKVDGTLNASAPLFSPDGDWLAYFGSGSIWKRRVAGGNPIKVVEAPGGRAGYDWAGDGQLTYSPTRDGGLARVGEDGGLPTFVTSLRRERGEVAHGAGVTLADGSAILFTIRDGNADARIDARELSSGKQHTVVERGSTPRLARTPTGTYLLWERAGTLYAAPFYTAKQILAGHEVPVTDGVMVDRVSGHAYYDVADDGTLAYVPGPAFAEESRLAWVNSSDFDGPTEPLDDDVAAYAEPHFTADGRRLSVLVKGEVNRPYVYDLQRRVLQRVMVQGNCAAAAISPDGRKLAYSTNKGGGYTLWLKDLGDGTDEQLTDLRDGSPGSIHWSPDGNAIAFDLTPVGGTRRDVFVREIAGKSAVSFAASPDADETTPRFSPNGNWLAFVSNESGSREVYIKSFPDGKVVRPVSIGGGGEWPQWTSDGRKLYYRGKGGLFLAPIAPNWADGSRPAIVRRTPFGQADADLADYAVAPDGRLLVVEPSGRGPAVSQVTVVLNWPQLLAPNSAPPTAPPTTPSRAR